MFVTVFMCAFLCVGVGVSACGCVYLLVCLCVCVCMRVCTDELASKTNIIIDPAEILTTSMDDLDEDEESGAAQVCLCVSVCVYTCAHLCLCASGVHKCVCVCVQISLPSNLGP